MLKVLYFASTIMSITCAILSENIFEFLAWASSTVFATSCFLLMFKSKSSEEQN